MLLLERRPIVGVPVASLNRRVVRQRVTGLIDPVNVIVERKPAGPHTVLERCEDIRSRQRGVVVVGIRDVGDRVSVHVDQVAAAVGQPGVVVRELDAACQLILPRFAAEHELVVVPPAETGPALGADLDHAVGRAGSVQRSPGCPLHDLHGLDVQRHQIIEGIGGDHAVDDDQGILATVDRSRAPEENVTRAPRLAGTTHHLDSGKLPLQERLGRDRRHGGVRDVEFFNRERQLHPGSRTCHPGHHQLLHPESLAGELGVQLDRSTCGYFDLKGLRAVSEDLEGELVGTGRDTHDHVAARRVAEDAPLRVVEPHDGRLEHLARRNVGHRAGDVARLRRRGRDREEQADQGHACDQRCLLSTPPSEDFPNI